MKKNMNIIENGLLILLVIVTSYQGVFVKINSFLDEFILIAIILYEFLLHYIIKKEKFSSKKLLFFTLFVVITSLNVIFKQYNGFAYFEEIFNFLKVILLFEVFSIIKIDEKRYKKIMKFFIFINIISMIIGILHYHFYSVIGYTIGDKFRNGKLRIDGLSGHPISLGFCALFCITYLMEKKSKKHKILSFILIIVFLYALILTQDRLALALLLLYLIVKIMLKGIKTIKANIRTVLPFIVFIGLGIGSIGFITQLESVNNYLKDDMEDTIRMFSIQKAAEIFIDYPILGTGIGTFGSRAAIKYDSYVYKKYDFSKFSYLINSSSGNVFESQLSKIIIESGIVGILFFGYFFFRYYQISIKNKDTLLFILLIYTNIFIILCNLYQIPFVISLALTISYNNTILKKEGITHE